MIFLFLLNGFIKKWIVSIFHPLLLYSNFGLVDLIWYLQGIHYAWWV